MLLKKSKKKSLQIDLSQDGKKKKRKGARLRLKVILIGIGIIIGVIIILGLASYPAAKTAYNHALQGKVDFEGAQTRLSEENFEEAYKSIARANENFNIAYDNVRKLAYLKVIPYLGRQVNTAEKLALISIKTSSALEKILKLAHDIVTPLKKDASDLSLADISEEEKNLILEKIYNGRPILDEAKDELEESAQLIEELSESGLIKQLKNIIDPLKEKLPLVNEILNRAIPTIKILPTITGYPEPKTYLFLLQNNTELRPTGGFIGTYGILKLKAGEIHLFATDNVYNLDESSDIHVEPPWQLKKYLAADSWYLRDSNWSPHFPEAAEKALWFYKQESGEEEELDGVISVTPTFIESLIKLTGDIKVNGITFTADNFVDVLQYQVDKGFYRQGIPESERKEIIGVLARIMLDRILALPQSKWPDLWQTLTKDLTEKQILIYVKDEGVQKIIQSQNWGGEITDYQGDYLTVIDANMASLKSDPGVFRTINYRLTEEDNGDLIADLEIIYDNQGTFNWKSTRYRTYTRVYVPQGSELISYEGVMDNDKLHGGLPGEVEVTEELGKTVFGGFISIEPREKGVLHFVYRPPQSVKDEIKRKNYRLLIQKQPGTIAHNLNVDLSFQKKWKWITPFDLLVQKDENRIKFATELIVDREFNILLK